MDKLFENKVSLAWHHDGKFTATIVNGIITDLSFCENGKGSEDCGKCLTSTDLKFLQSVHQSLGELFKELEAETERMGHSYSVEGSVKG